MDSLLAHVIHDAKNLLAVLQASLEQARQEYRRETGRDDLPSLQRAGQLSARLNVQLLELLALYRDSKGALQLAIDDHDLGDFLDELRADWVSSGELTAGFESDDEAARKLGVWAFDAYQVRLILTDALRNANRHARNRVRFTASPQPGSGLRFSIEDDGPGYDEILLKKSREVSPLLGDAAHPMQASGSGLGLRFARLIADHHAAPGGRRGRVELANDGLGQGGARFTLILP